MISSYFCKNYPSIEYKINTFTSVGKFENFLEANNSDIIFLDINIDGNENCGIEIAKKLRQKNANCNIVFFTSFTEKIGLTLEALIKPSGFLSKPIKVSEINELMHNIISEMIQSDKYITTKFGRNHFVIHINDIIIITKKGRHTVFNLSNRQIEITEPIKSFVQKLPAYFIPVDKGELVNTYKITQVDYMNRYIYLNNQIKISMSRNAKKKVKSALTEFFN